MKYLLLSPYHAAFPLLEDIANYLQVDKHFFIGNCVSDRIIEIVIPPAKSDPRLTFNDIHKKLTELLDQDDITVLVSEVAPLNLNPLQNMGWESLLSMLILAFPETNWFFGTINGIAELENKLRSLEQEGGSKQVEISVLINKLEPLSNFRDNYGIKNFFKPTINPLYDGFGLRNWIRRLAQNDEETRGDASYLPCRIQSAVALDEEEPYAALHAYAAYRFGFRGVPVSTKSLSLRLLGDSKSNSQDAPELIFEDVYLNFPDGAGDGFSDLRKRVNEEEGFPRLERIQNRIFVSSGQRLQGDREKWASNKAYIQEQKSSGRHITSLPKPHAGIFSLWEAADLTAALKWKDEITGKEHKGTGKGFIWPPLKESFRASSHGHSAPGVLLSIATNLLSRATKLRKDGIYSVQEAVKGAVLANEALELLGGRTPTESIEALNLKHQFEVLAECQFSGVEFHLELEPRLAEIRNEVEHICRWFDPKKQKVSAWNAEMSILTGIMRIFQEHAQFDEEQVCRNRARHLHNTLWMQQQPVRKIAWPVLRYLEFLLNSFPKFLIALMGWVLGLAILYWWAGTYDTSTVIDKYGFWKGIEDSVSSFFSMGNPMHHGLDKNLNGYSVGYAVVYSITVVSGFVHLGVFISHLYSILNRK